MLCFMTVCMYRDIHTTALYYLTFLLPNFFTKVTQFLFIKQVVFDEV